MRSRYPLLADTCKVIADPIVRNLATIGGNLAHGDPANDHPATMLAFGAEIVAVGGGGERKIPITSFFTGPPSTARKPDEIVVEIRVPIPKPGSGGAYVKLERKVGDFATARGVAATLAANGTCTVGIGSPRGSGDQGGRRPPPGKRRRHVSRRPARRVAQPEGPAGRSVQEDLVRSQAARSQAIEARERELSHLVKVAITGRARRSGAALSWST